MSSASTAQSQHNDAAILLHSHSEEPQPLIMLSSEAIIPCNNHQACHTHVDTYALPHGIQFSC